MALMQCSAAGSDRPPASDDHAIARPRTRRAKRAAVFIDKDGTLIDDVPYNVDPSSIRLTVRAGEALHELSMLGYALVVVTNQPGVELGFFDEAALLGVDRCIGELLAPHGVSLDGFYWCPHAPDDNGASRCECRKPRPGMLERAAHELDLDLAHSWMVGDILNDVEAGRRAGCRTVLLDNGNETRWELGPLRTPHYIADDFDEIARTIERLASPAQRKRARQAA